MMATMNWNFAYRLLITFLLAGSLGCSKAPRHSFFGAFDLQAVVDQCTSRDIHWGGHGTSSGGAGPPAGNNRTKHFIGELDCDSERADSFLQCLKKKFQNLIDAFSGTYSDVTEPSGDEGTRQFRLDYELGNEIGTVTATLKPNTDTQNAYRYPFEVQIELEELPRRGSN